MLRWAGGCDCHAPDEPGANQCAWQGRRVASIHAFASGELLDGFLEANEWPAGKFGSVDVGPLQGAVRLAALFGHEVIEPYNTIPLLAAQLDRPGVRDECLRQWAAAPRECHHPASAKLFDDTPGSLRDAVFRIDDDGTVHDDMLKKEILSLRQPPPGRLCQ